MIDLIFALIAAAAPAPSGPQDNAQAATPDTTSSGTVIVGENVETGDSATVSGLVAEPQVASGKFTTAVEVKPILTATRGNWVAVREYNGQDLVYVTHLWAWRCGLLNMSISVNDGPMEPWPLPECHMEYASPNAVLDTDGLPYRSHALGSVQNVSISITYDDLSTDMATFQRSDVLIP